MRRISKYLETASTYVDLSDGNRHLSTCRVVYKSDKDIDIDNYVNANSSHG